VGLRVEDLCELERGAMSILFGAQKTIPLVMGGLAI
jgi:hypothetical protein